MVLLDHLHDRLRYLQPTLRSLLDSACGLSRLADTPYISRCRDALEEGENFPLCWRRETEAYSKVIGKEEAELLAALSDVLGAADLDSQLSSLTYTHTQLEHYLELARQNRARYQKLYSTLGILVGLALAIILV